MEKEEEKHSLSKNTLGEIHDKNRTTVFRQLILNVIVPVALALVTLASLNYFHTRSLLQEANVTKNELISDEIKRILQFQDLAFDIVETRLDARMRDYSHRLINDYLLDTKDIEGIDLDQIREDMGMIPDLEDIYIINREGIVVNTTFKQDLGLNMYAFGESTKKFLLEILSGNLFVAERFAVEHNTKRIKKYTYHPTKDNLYIVEMGVYSKKADDITEFIKNSINLLSYKQETIKEVDLFIGGDNPFSLNTDTELKKSHMATLLDVFEKKTNRKFEENFEGKSLVYEYLYMDRKNTDLYKGAVIRIISDRTSQINILQGELLKSILISLITLVAVIVLIYQKTKVITNPIRKLVNNVTRITKGNMSERADIEGNNEITTLSTKFNVMIEELESYYIDLEAKVKERTAEISKQKEKIEIAYHEIEEQKKNITDSIRYAQRIQAAILPPQKYISKKLQDYFILFRPRDIVSGDFYWYHEKGRKAYIAAIDCTGHGVPGAFVSMIGNDLLNQIVIEKNNSDPGLILSLLSKGVKQAFTRGGEQEAQDGMDMALCVIDPENKTLEFAGAQNPLILIQNETFEYIRGDSMPIGGITELDYKFAVHKFNLNEGDQIFIYSDGYQDQFGGPKGKKFMSKKFKNLLFDVSSKSTKEQKVLLEDSLDNWQGSLEQTDDILIIGIRI